MGKAAQAQAGRHRARDARLKAARERRLKLDPDQLARERRIDGDNVSEYRRRVTRMRASCR